MTLLSSLFPPFLVRVFKKLESHSKGPENVLDDVLEKDQPMDFPAPSSVCREAGQEINGDILLAEPAPSRHPTEPNPHFLGLLPLTTLTPASEDLFQCLWW